MALTKFPMPLIIAGLIIFTASTVSASTIEIQFSPNDSITINEGSDTTAVVEFADTANTVFTPIISIRDTTGFTSATVTRHVNPPDQVFLRASLNIAPGYAKWGFYGIDFVAFDSLGDSLKATLFLNVLDNLRPETLNVFAVDSVGQSIGTVRLSWNAPHEDSIYGGAVAKYHLRYSITAPVNPQAWWNAADSMPILPPMPSSPGQSQIAYLSNLSEYQSRWYGIRSEDAAGNLSAISIRGPITPRHRAPIIQLLGDIPDTVKPDSMMYFTGVTSDSGGALTSIRYSANGTTWSAVHIDSIRDSTAIYIRKYFHFIQNSDTASNITISIRAFDSGDSTTYQHTVRVDRTRPNHPTVTPEQDSLTSSTLFRFNGSKDRDASVWSIIAVGSNVSAPQRITDAEDTSLTWNYSQNIYYQGAVTFAFYATDRVGNFSDTIRFSYFLIPNSPNIIDTATVDYHNSTIFNPVNDSFFFSFQISQISYFKLSISDDMGALVYQTCLDSLAVGEHSISWSGIRNQRPDSGGIVPDGRYLAAFSARTYPVSPFDVPNTVQLIVDSHAPFLIELTPNSHESNTAPRVINSNTTFELILGDTGAVAVIARAAIMAPYFEYGTAGEIHFTLSDTAANRWSADLSTIDPPLPSGTYSMTLVISDEAGNENRYVKIYSVTADRGITDFRNAPNPFSPSVEHTRIVYTLGQAVSDLTLEIYDSAGDLVYRQSLDATNLLPGNPEIVWDGRSAWGKKLNNGVYFARLTGDINTDFIKIAIADR
jgi:hypothetical protein